MKTLRLAEILVAPYWEDNEQRYAAFTSIVKGNSLTVCKSSNLQRAIEMAIERIAEEGYDLFTVDKVERAEQITEFADKYLGKDGGIQTAVTA